jgi:hypothetical protein
LSSEWSAIRGDSNPHQRTLDLFELRHFSLARLLPPEAFARPPRRLIGPPDETLRALNAEGLTLRQIAERVSMSAEGVRLRLRESTP